MLMLFMATTLAMFGCGSGMSTDDTQEDSPPSSPVVPTDNTGAWDDYRDSLLAWADDFGVNPPATTQYGEEGHGDIDVTSYRKRLEGELEDLNKLEQMKPPAELVALHQRLVDAFRGFCQADELYGETQAAKNYLAAIKAGIEAQQQLDKVNAALLELVQASAPTE